MDAYYLFIYLFHMPLFMFVSGYLSKNLEKRRNLAFEELFIPYVIFQVVVGGLFLVTTHSAEALSNILIPQFGAWYLISLFTFRVFMPNLIKIKYILPISILINILACLSGNIGSVFGLNKSLGFFVFFLLGYYVTADKIELLRKKINPIIATIILLVSLIIAVLVFSKCDYSVWLSILSRTADVSLFTDSLTAIFVHTIALAVTIFLRFFCFDCCANKK